MDGGLAQEVVTECDRGEHLVKFRTGLVHTLSLTGATNEAEDIDEC